MSERTEGVLIGLEARQANKARIKELASIVKGNRGWRKAFAKAYPLFDSTEGVNQMIAAQQGRAHDPLLLKYLEEWIPRVIEEQPDWYVKQNHLTSDIQL